eukprot:CAMPEP_0119065898 /NCGR_PEP_ID=MMETSP1178-20130426/8606_1 /TAXON_ID=33656 /ORGANISM="unid sp, Strain CCMP2000" /LENGTH=33 /DNA_ID= /DNA_START= /DNA_END= /DNA_ORIENTATION=
MGVLRSMPVSQGEGVAFDIPTQFDRTGQALKPG